MRRDRTRVGIVGAGDVAHRHYLPALRSLSGSVLIAAVADPGEGAAEAVAAAVAGWSPRLRVERDIDGLLGTADLDAVINLTPAPRHGAVNRAILEAGLACYSEKPLAATVAEADDLIALPADRAGPFLLAPGSAVTNRGSLVED